MNSAKAEAGMSLSPFLLTLGQEYSNFFLSACTAWALCLPKAQQAVVTALEVRVLTASPQALKKFIHLFVLGFSFPKVVIEVVSANEENSFLHNLDHFPFWVKM